MSFLTSRAALTTGFDSWWRFSLKEGAGFDIRLPHRGWAPEGGPDRRGEVPLTPDDQTVLSLYAQLFERLWLHTVAVSARVERGEKVPQEEIDRGFLLLKELKSCDARMVERWGRNSVKK